MKTIEHVLDYRQAVQLGINAPIYSEAYMRSAEEKGIWVRTPYEIRQAGWPETIRTAVAQASRGGVGVYVSVDIDSIDQSEAPGTSVPNVNGLRGGEVIDAVFAIARSTEIVGFDIVEVNPLLDRDDMTSRLAAQILHSMAAGIASKLS
jgi:agmatinase